MLGKNDMATKVIDSRMSIVNSHNFIKKLKNVIRKIRKKEKQVLAGKENLNKWDRKAWSSTFLLTVLKITPKVDFISTKY